MADPELATLTRERFFDPAPMYERTFDGEHCLAHRDGTGVALMTRHRQRVNSTHPELAAGLAAGAGQPRHPRYLGLRRDGRAVGDPRASGIRKTAGPGACSLAAMVAGLTGMVCLTHPPSAVAET